MRAGIPPDKKIVNYCRFLFNTVDVRPWDFLFFASLVVLIP